MAALKRLQKEYQELQDKKGKDFQIINIVDSNFLKWHGIIQPNKSPYNKAAFQIEIKFSADYPFVPPKIHFLTKIYHPNVDEDGQICLPIISADHWKPVTKVEDVIVTLLDLINDPQPENALRPDLAHEMANDLKSFQKKANEFTLKHGIKKRD